MAAGEGTGCVLLSAGMVVSILTAAQAGAAVGGACYNCHTMHNSQAGGVVDEGNQSFLLISGCVGCHSHEGTATIVQMDATRIPIVYNTGSAPEQMLAGGNFHWVVENGDQFGHNVLGISEQDRILGSAPGGSAGCANSCHQSLALATVNVPGAGSLTPEDGCRNCHGSVRHHGEPLAPGQPATEASGWYRFLKAPDFHGFASTKPGISGIGDPDWEQNPTSEQHNVYVAGDGSPNPEPRPLSKFCTGCHQNFHAPGGDANGGGASPWLRHPTNIAIPDQGEFSAIIGAAYNPLVPVSKPSLSGFNIAVVEPGDQVACVSCHRAHGSPYPDMLRWDYAKMTAHDAGDAAGTGCFYCHTQKDG